MHERTLIDESIFRGHVNILNFVVNAKESFFTHKKITKAFYLQMDELAKCIQEKLMHKNIHATYVKEISHECMQTRCLAQFNLIVLLRRSVISFFSRRTVTAINVLVRSMETIFEQRSTKVHHATLWEFGPKRTLWKASWLGFGTDGKSPASAGHRCLVCLFKPQHQHENSLSHKRSPVEDDKLRWMEKKREKWRNWPVKIG